VSDLAQRIAALRWYHSIDFPGGLSSAGLFDHRGLPPRLPIPASLAGQRCLDIGTSDGFWAFEMERRGAEEVVAIDLPDPAQQDLTVGVSLEKGSSPRSLATFELAREALGSQVEWRAMNVYDLSREAIGRFDFVFMGSLLLHLRDPVAALTAVRSVVAGRLLSFDSISPMLTVLAPRTPAATLHAMSRSEWWIPNKAARVREIEAVGFRVLGSGGVTWVRRRGIALRPTSFRRRPFSVALLAFKGAPHTWVLATA
jgi:tRNA (mo5U34)-methyltransferase